MGSPSQSTAPRKIIRQSNFSSRDPIYTDKNFRKVGSFSVIENGIRKVIPAHKVKEFAKRIAKTRGGHMIRGGKGTLEGDLATVYKLSGSTERASKREKLLKAFTGPDDDKVNLAKWAKIKAQRNVRISRLTGMFRDAEQQGQYGIKRATVSSASGIKAGRDHDTVKAAIEATNSGRLGLQGVKYKMYAHQEEELNTQDFREQADGRVQSAKIYNFASAKAANNPSVVPKMNAAGLTAGINRPGVNRPGMGSMGKVIPFRRPL